jgi:hypothetical protein
MTPTYQPSSTLAAVLQGEIASAEHWRDEKGTVMVLKYVGGKSVNLRPNSDGRRLDFSVAEEQI